MKIRLFAMILLCVCLSGGTQADELGKFEEDTTKSQDDSGRHLPHRRRHEDSGWEHSLDDDDDGGWGDLCSDLILSVLSEGFSQSLDYLPPEPSRFRDPGDPLLPYFRLDGAWQDATGRIEAEDFYIQGGYGPMAVDYRQTYFTEDRPRTHLDLHWLHFLARMRYGEQVELDLGVGGFWMEGTRRTDGISLSAALLVYPEEYWGLEFRPTVAMLETESSIRDYDLALHYRQELVGVKVGYRWTKSPNVTLEGPYLGLVFRW